MGIWANGGWAEIIRGHEWMMPCMAGLLKTIAKLLAYKGPVDAEGFELLEGEDEGTDREKRKEPLKDANEAPKKSGKITRKPLKLGTWIEKQKEEAGQLPPPDKRVARELNLNLERIKQEFYLPANKDVIVRKFKIARRVDAFFVVVEGMVDKATINDFILRQLMAMQYPDDLQADHLVDYIMDNVLPVDQVVKSKEMEDAIGQVLSGQAALFIDGCGEVLLIETRGYERRNVEKPAMETVVIGPQEAFTENLRTNLTLLRRIIKNRKLITEMSTIGTANNTNCAIMYLEDVANPELVREVKKRLTSVKADFVLGSGMMRQQIKDRPFTSFPNFLTTERPDRTASFIMEGNVAIITDGTPLADVVPVTLYSMLHTSEDSFVGWQFGTFLRLIRLLGLALDTFLPGFYIAMMGYHHELLYSTLLFSIARTRENVPFPAVVEVILMLVAFELIREAGVRVPGVIGTTLGILGALILGQAAVTAELVSPISIIVVALTGLGSYVIPNFSLSFTIRLIRLLVIIFAAISGLYGFTMAMLIVGALACSMKSFGVPFLTPIAPKTKFSPDIIIRRPSWQQRERPDYLNLLDKKRLPDGAGKKGRKNKP